MIKPNELRIGNWVHEVGPAFKREVQVIAIDSDREHEHLKGVATVREYLDNGESFGDVGKWLDRLHPIPLTPEWLVNNVITSINKTILVNTLIIFIVYLFFW